MILVVDKNDMPIGFLSESVIVRDRPRFFVSCYIGPTSREIENNEACIAPVSKILFERVETFASRDNRLYIGHYLRVLGGKENLGELGQAFTFLAESQVGVYNRGIRPDIQKGATI